MKIQAIYRGSSYIKDVSGVIEETINSTVTIIQDGNSCTIEMSEEYSIDDSDIVSKLVEKVKSGEFELTSFVTLKKRELDELITILSIVSKKMN